MTECGFVDSLLLMQDDQTDSKVTGRVASMQVKTTNPTYIHLFLTGFNPF